MSKVLGIINFAGSMNVTGLQDYRPTGAISFLGRYRVIDFPISNFSNSDIEDIEVYVRRKPRSLAEHIGTGRQYNINSKNGRLYLLFAEESMGSLYSNDIGAYIDNMEVIEGSNAEYVVLTPSYMVYKQNFEALVEQHKASGADITLLYHQTDQAKEKYLSCQYLEMNKQKGVTHITNNRGNAKNRPIFMDTYVMTRELFIQLVKDAHKTSSLFTMKDYINVVCDDLDIRGVAHRGYFASITDFKSYYDANIELIDRKTAEQLFTEDWPIYTKTSDSCPTQYLEGADVKASVISNGCVIEGTVNNSVLGRGVIVKKGAVIKNSVILPDVEIGEDVVIENMVVDKHVKINHVKDIKGDPENPGYVKRFDRI